MVTALKNEGFRIKKIDIRTQPTLVKKHGVWRNPTYIYMVNGKEVRRGTGSKSIGTVRNMFRKPFF